MDTRVNNLDAIIHPKNNQFFLLAGPCVVESEEICMQIADTLVSITQELGIPYVFKASYRKANRSKLDSFSGNGDVEGLEIIAKIAKKYNIPVVTDIHSAAEAEMAAKYVDILQIPAFLARQTDILVAAAKTGKYVNIKKGQFMAPAAMKFAADKVSASGNTNILLTDRGTMFGYQDLIVDFRGIPEMKQTGYPVIMDITHSLQQPNQTEGVSGGLPALIETIARGAIACGVDGIFMETHPHPEKALSDGANMLALGKVKSLLNKLTLLKETINTLDGMK